MMLILAEIKTYPHYKSDRELSFKRLIICQDHHMLHRVEILSWPPRKGLSVLMQLGCLDVACLSWAGFMSLVCSGGHCTLLLFTILCCVVVVHANHFQSVCGPGSMQTQSSDLMKKRIDVTKLMSGSSSVTPQRRSIETFH